MFYITGDTHGQFERIEAFCKRFETTKGDVMIILGDVGINYSGGSRDRMKKEFLDALPITIFAIHGNHEQRPQTIEGYQEKVWHGGVVWLNTTSTFHPSLSNRLSTYRLISSDGCSSGHQPYPYMSRHALSML